MEPEKANGESADTNRRVFHLQLSSILTFVFLTLFAIVLAYVCGVMSGRHMQAGEIENASAYVDKNRAQLGEAGADNRILSAEELEFAKVLRGEKPQSVKKESVEPQSKNPAVPEPKAVENKTLENKVPEKTLEEAQAQYDYVFQMGAFKDELQVDGLRQKLEGMGLRTVMQRSGKVYLVLVRMRGNASRVEDLNKVAMALKLGSPMMLSRKPVSP